MPRTVPSPPKGLAALALTAVLLVGAGCDGSGPDYHGMSADPPDLRVRQSPNDTIRVGETVTFIAVFRDSLTSKWLYSWTLNVFGRDQTYGHERSIRWTPQVAGSYTGGVSVSNAAATSRARLNFETVVLP